MASFLPRLGYKNAMLAALAIVTAACVAMPLLPGFATARLLFLCVGVAFALVKVSVYSTLGLIVTDRGSGGTACLRSFCGAADPAPPGSSRMA